MLMVHCDFCGKSEAMNGAGLFLRVERPYIRLMQDPDAWYFCSWQCLGRYGLSLKGPA